MSKSPSPVPPGAVPDITNAPSFTSYSAELDSLSQQLVSKVTFKPATAELDNLPQELVDKIVDYVVVPGEGKEQSMGLFLTNKRMHQSILRILPQKNAWAHEAWWFKSKARRAYVANSLRFTVDSVCDEMWYHWREIIFPSLTYKTMFSEFRMQQDSLKGIIKAFVKLALNKYAPGAAVGETRRALHVDCLMQAQGAKRYMVRTLYGWLKNRAKATGTWLTVPEFRAILTKEEAATLEDSFWDDKEMLYMLE